MKHKCDGCEYRGTHQEMGFRPFGVCLKETNLIEAENSYNDEKCPHKEEHKKDNTPLVIETLNNFENRIYQLENSLVTDAISYGIVRHYTYWDLWFEQDTNGIDRFVMRLRDEEGSIIGIFPEEND